MNARATAPSDLLIAPTHTQTTVATDHLATTATFITRPHIPERHPSVEEDSTDIFVLERCSPLNDF